VKKEEHSVLGSTWSATPMLEVRLVDLTPSWGSKGGKMSPIKGGVVRLNGGERGRCQGL